MMTPELQKALDDCQYTYELIEEGKRLRRKAQFQASEAIYNHRMSLGLKATEMARMMGVNRMEMNNIEASQPRALESYIKWIKQVAAFQPPES